MEVVDMLNKKDIVYGFKNRIYFSFRDITLGIMIGTNEELVYGLFGRIWFLEINLLFIHFKIGIVRHGNSKGDKKNKQ